VSAPKPAPISPKVKKVCDVLIRDKHFGPEKLEAIFLRVQRAGDRVEEAVIQLGLIDEAKLLKSLAAHYQVYFVSTEKLSKAEPSRQTLALIPQRFAETSNICPIQFDAATKTLTIVTADPENLDMMREVQFASGAREVKAILARPAAVKALIGKTYGGEQYAFRLLVAQAQPTIQSIAFAYSRDSVTLDAEDEAPSVLPPPPPPLPPPRGRQAGASPAAPLTPPPPAAVPPRLPTPTGVRYAPGTAPSTAAPPAPQPVAAPVPAPAPRPPSAPPEVATVKSPSSRPPAGPSDKGISSASFLELLHVLVSLLESSRADLRGHSAQVGRLVRQLAEKMGLEPSTTAMMIAAAFVHDLGKMGSYHLTAFNCSEYDGHKVAAQKAYGFPARLLEPVRLPIDTMLAATHMYERYDGKGFPDGFEGKDIPLGARVLAICDTYADLTSNARNPFRRTLTPQEACNTLAKHKETIFDPNLVDLFKNTVLGEELAAKLLATRSQALLIDVDPEETTVLELRMIEQGFVVRIARTQDQALKILSEGETDLVIAEIDLGPADGLQLLAEARRQPWGKDVPWVIYSRRQERAIAQRAFELGVVDYVTKPASADVLVAKLKAMLEQRANASPRSAQGVSGSLREMGLPDMVQVLFHGRKSGNLKIRGPEGGIGEIHFIDGNVVNATFGGQKGEDAFYQMLKLQDGEFGLDPSFKPTERTIEGSSEGLLLEGMRRLDEGLI
jgi:response regulator RpfG family c-di-GMP phosphodiesterase